MNYTTTDTQAVIDLVQHLLLRLSVVEGLDDAPIYLDDDECAKITRAMVAEIGDTVISDTCEGVRVHIHIFFRKNRTVAADVSVAGSSVKEEISL